MNQRGTTIGARGTVGCRGTQSQSLPARVTEKCLGIQDCPEASLCLRDPLCFSSTSLLPSLAFSQSLLIIPSLTLLHTIADSLSLTSCKPEITGLRKPIKNYNSIKVSNSNHLQVLDNGSLELCNVFARFVYNLKLSGLQIFRGNGSENIMLL